MADQQWPIYILAFRRLIEEVKKHNLKAVLVFVDYKKALDIVHHEKIFKMVDVITAVQGYPGQGHHA